MEIGFSTPIKNNKAFESDHASYTDDVIAHSTFQTPAKGYADYDTGLHSGREHMALSSDLNSHIKSIVNEFKTDSAVKHDAPLKMEDLAYDVSAKIKTTEECATAETTPAVTSLYNPTSSYLLSSHVSDKHNLALSHHLSPHVETYTSTYHHAEPGFGSLEKEKASVDTGATYSYGGTSSSIYDDIKKYLPADHHYLHSTTTTTASYQPEKVITTTDHEVPKSSFLSSLLTDDKHSYEQLTHVNDTPSKLKTETLFNLGNRNEELIKSIVGQYKDLNDLNSRKSANVLYEDPLSLTQTKLSSSNVFKNSHVFTSTPQPTYTPYTHYDHHDHHESTPQPTYTTYTHYDHHEPVLSHYPDYSSNTLEQSEKIATSMSQKIDHIDAMIQEIKNRNAKMTNTCLHSLGHAPIEHHDHHLTSHNDYDHHHDSQIHHRHQEGSLNKKNEAVTHVKETKHHHKEATTTKSFDISTQFLAKAVTALLVIILVIILTAQLFYDFQ